MRKEFCEIVDDWTLIANPFELTDRILLAASWTIANGPLEPDERATIALMMKVQIVLNMKYLTRIFGLEAEFGLPRDDGPEGW